MEKVQYKVIVKTGDLPFSGTNAHVYIILHGNNKETSDTIQLDSGQGSNFALGQTDAFIFDLNNLGEISMIEFWRDDAGLCEGWYVEMVNVVNGTTKTEVNFPILRWVKADFHHKILPFDTNVPTKGDPNLDSRRKELENKKNVYVLKERSRNLPAQMAFWPVDETISLLSLGFGIFTKQVLLNVASVLDKWLTKNWNTLDDLKNLYDMIVFEEPAGVHLWKQDVSFGYQRIVGVNNSLIELCEEIPINLGIKHEVLEPLLDGCTYDQVIKEKRLFICDLKILDRVKHKDGFHVCAPIALFLVNGRGELVPIAIQLYQEKGPNNPVFLPTDPEYTWMLAKMWYNNADSAYHQSLTHLGFTHLLMEGIVAITHRNLSQSHPLFKLLAPHFLNILAINRLAFDHLVTPNGWIDRTMNIGVVGLFDLLERGTMTWKMDDQGTLPNDLMRRRVDDQNVLPEYYFRDDALLLYNAIKYYVTQYVSLYYDNEEKINEDWELQSWRNEMTKPRKEGGCGLQGVPGIDNKFTTADQVIQTLTCLIYTSSVAHAATNFPQYEEYGFPPHYPAFMRGTPPSTKDPLTEEHVINSLPDKDTTLEIMIITRILSKRGTKRLGDFEVQYIFDPNAKEIVQAFKKELENISEGIKKRNGDRKRDRKRSYEFLDPQFVPNSISI